MERILRSFALSADDIYDIRPAPSYELTWTSSRGYSEWRMTIFAEESRAAMGDEMIELLLGVPLRFSAILGTYGALRTIFGGT